jgi:hypothetical protein
MASPCHLRGRHLGGGLQDPPAFGTVAAITVGTRPLGASPHLDIHCARADSVGQVVRPVVKQHVSAGRQPSPHARPPCRPLRSLRC